MKRSRTGDWQHPTELIIITAQRANNDRVSPPLRSQSAEYCWQFPSASHLCQKCIEQHDIWRVSLKTRRNDPKKSGVCRDSLFPLIDPGAAGFVWCLTGIYWGSIVKTHPPCAVLIGSMLQITRLFAKGEIKKGDYFWPFVCLEKRLLILRQLVPRSSERSLAAILLLFCCLRDPRSSWSSAPLRCSEAKFLPPPFLNGVIVFQ